jgi:hypothetical protein
MGSVTRGKIVARSSCPNCASDQLTEAGALLCLSCGDTFTPPGWGWDAESFGAHENKALDGGTLPVPMTWIDGGGQLPYSHVVVDVSGSMATPTFTPNWSGEGQFSRAEYVMFLLLEMYLKGAIKADTRIYPHTSQSLGAFISAGFALSPDVGPEVWPLLFAPHAGSTKLNHMSKLPHTKTLLITDVGEQSLPRLVGGTWVVSPEYKKFQKSLKKGWIGETPKFSGVRGNIENAPFDIISW